MQKRFLFRGTEMYTTSILFSLAWHSNIYFLEFSKI